VAPISAQASPPAHDLTKRETGHPFGHFRPMTPR
jgi:hypothetical protein